MSGQEAKAPPLRFRMSPAESAENAEGGRVSSTAENAARGETRPPAPWETKRLGDVADYSLEKNSKMETTEAFTNSAEHGIISQLDFFDFDVAKRLSRYSLVRPDDFVYNPRISTSAPFGPINRNELGRCGAMSPLYSVFRCHDIDLDYLQVYFKTDCWHDFMRFNGDTGARFDRFSIRNDLFLDMPVFVPTTQIEQRRIGSLFRSLDALIAGREKALEKLEALKKSMLLKMFPQGDATVPEVRFKGFTGDWEKKRLGIFFEERDESNRDGAETEILSVMKDVGVIRYADKGNVGNRAKEDVTQYNIARKGDIVLNSMNVIIGSVGVAPCAGCISPAYYALIPLDNADASFWGYWFWRKESQCVISSLACGMMEIRRKISVEDLLSIVTPVPTLPEQQKIGAYFRSLDALLSARREEIGKLKQMKKALLERMFV